MATRASDIPPPPPGFAMVQPPAGFVLQDVPPPPPAGFVHLAPGTLPHDGDTLPLGDGRNGRLYGADAFELGQPGYRRDGSRVDLGAQARGALIAQTADGFVPTPTGTASYGRPVVSLSANGRDVGGELIREGMAVAAPDYLRGDPIRLPEYMEAERLARLNRLGAHADQFQMPDAYRHKEPWAPAQASADGKGDVLFFDEPTPFQGLRPEIAQGYVELAQDRRSRPADLLAYGKAHGFTISEADANSFVKKRDAGANVSDEVKYGELPRVLTDMGDGATGAAARGLADPFNFLDEMGGIVDSLGGTHGRENVFNSDRRFGDVLWNNIDQNRDILGHDEAFHPWARIGGQLASGAIAPSLSIEGLGLRAATEVMRAGGTRFAAKIAAKAAIRDRLAIAGALEGGVAGAGAGEGGVVDRVSSALAGAGVGAAGGVLIGEAAPYVASGVRRLRGIGGAVDDAAASAPGPVARGIQAVRRLFRSGTDAEGAPPAALRSREPPAPPPGFVHEAPAPVVQPVLHEDAVARNTDLSASLSSGSANMDHDIHAASITGPAEAPEGSASAVVPARPARTIAEARDAALDFVGQPIRNEATGVEATVSGNTVRKMTSGKAVGKSTSEDDHALAVANVDDLFRRATLAERYADERGEPTISAISRWHAPLRTPNGVRMARMTVKETTHPDSPNPLYTVETVELEGSGTRIGASASAPGQNRNVAPPGSAGDIDPAADLGNAPSLGRARRMDQPASASDMADLARTVDPRDVTPLPANTIGSLDEAVRTNPGTIRDVAAPDERSVLPVRQVKPGGRMQRNPLDLIGWLRANGGIKDHGGDLEHLGIDNKPRDLDFARDEGFLGKLIDQRGGKPLDEAAHAAWEAGYFPNHAERPTVSDFIDALGETHRGGPARVFHPDDYATIDDFHRARDQRRVVERAASEGAPLAEETGQPVTLDDLDANQPPATAYDDLPSIAAKAGNIDVSKLESRGDIVRAILNTHKAVGGFDAARRGTISHAETEALARDLRMTPDDLFRRKQGQALNAEQALAARSILAKSADELVGLARKAIGGSDADLVNFRTAWVRHVAIQEQVSGAAAEAGRALSQFRAMAKSSLPVGRIHKLAIDNAGGRDALEEAAQTILDGKGDPAQLNQDSRLMLKPGMKDKLVELYYNSLLSGPQTHVVNILSNTLTALAQLPEHGMAAAIGVGRKAVLRGDADVDRVLGSEIGARAAGMIQGVQEGMGQAARTMLTGHAPDPMSKVEASEQHAISGLKGSIIRTPTRALTAEDEFFKAVARKMETAGLAVRKARSEGLKGDALKQRIADLNANPTDDMVERAFDYGRYITFQRPLGKAGQAISAFTADFPVAKLIVPFVRTPTNILKFAIERSPGAPLLKEWRADMMAGGARRDLALSKVILGSGIGAMATSWAASGKITGGGPADESAKRLMEADGWQPYSVKVGNRYYSYQRLDPFSSTLGIAADMVDLRSHMTEKQHEEVASLLVGSILQNLASKTWLSGVSSATAAMNDPGRYADSWLSRMAGGIAVPAVVAQSATALDPLERQPRSILDRIRSRVPGVRQGIEPRRDVFGRPIASGGGYGPDIVSPVWTSDAKNDATIRELLAVGARVSPPQRTVAGHELSDQEYGRYAELAGGNAKSALDDLVRGDDWKELSREDRQDAVQKVIAAARRDARDTLGLVKAAH